MTTGDWVYLSALLLAIPMVALGVFLVRQGIEAAWLYLAGAIFGLLTVLFLWGIE